MSLPKLPKLKKVSEADIKGTEFAQNFHTVTPHEGFTREDALNPMSWGHVAKRLRPMDEIRICPMDGSFYARYLVLFSDKSQAMLKELEYHQLDALDPKTVPVSEHEVQWKGTAAKFAVVRIADKEIIRSGFANKAEATAWMQANLHQKAA